MLARLEDYGLSPTRPFHGGLVAHSYPQGLDHDMHQAFEIGVVLSGRMERHYEGTVLTLDPGEVWLCAAWEPHGWRPTAPDTRDLVLQFLPEFLGEEVFGRRSWLGLFAVPPELRPRLIAPAARDRVQMIAGELWREMEERAPGWLPAVRLWILHLLLTVSRGWEPPAAASRSQAVQPSSMAKLMPAVRLVQSNPSHRVRLEEAAAVCGLGVSQFTHSFRRLMGLSFRSFGTRARLAAAAQLLLSTDRSVEDIAQHLGFADASHLHHGFTAAYGCTPAQYRIRGRATGDSIRYTVLEEFPPREPSADTAPSPRSGER